MFRSLSRSSSTDRSPASHRGVVAEIDRFFGVQDSGSTIATELRGGLTTFVTMAYIVVVNADLLSKAGILIESAIFATCASSAIGTFLMAWWAGYPFALAPGRGSMPTSCFRLFRQSLLRSGLDLRTVPGKLPWGLLDGRAGYFLSPLGFRFAAESCVGFR